MQLKSILTITLSIAAILSTEITIAKSKAAQPKAPTFTAGSDPLKSGKWVLVENVSDEFNGKKLDTSKWCADPLANGWNWQGGNESLFTPESVTLEDGAMVITVGAFDKPREVMDYGKLKSFKYHSALVRSINMSTVGRYYECRMKMNKTELGGGFWLMTPHRKGKAHEIDIIECIGQQNEGLTHSWAYKADWTQIMHSNAIHRKSAINIKDERDSGVKRLDFKNSDRYVVYGAWWKSPTEIICFMDGEYVYTMITPKDDATGEQVLFDLPSAVQFSIENYEWNPVPKDGGKVVSLPLEDRKTLFDWVRVWEVK